jgi:hypothetical protein
MFMRPRGARMWGCGKLALKLKGLWGRTTPIAQSCRRASHERFAQAPATPRALRDPAPAQLRGTAKAPNAEADREGGMAHNLLVSDSQTVHGKRCRQGIRRV